jgi:hypothetical protein
LYLIIWLFAQQVSKNVLLLLVVVVVVVVVVVGGGGGGEGRVLVSRKSVVGIAKAYGVDGPDFESRQVIFLFSETSRPAPGPT